MGALTWVSIWMTVLLQASAYGTPVKSADDSMISKSHRGSLARELDWAKCSKGQAIAGLVTQHATGFRGGKHRKLFAVACQQLEPCSRFCYATDKLCSEDILAPARANVYVNGVRTVVAERSGQVVVGVETICCAAAAVRLSNCTWHSLQLPSVEHRSEATEFARLATIAGIQVPNGGTVVARNIRSNGIEICVATQIPGFRPVCSSETTPQNNKGAPAGQLRKKRSSSSRQKERGPSGRKGSKSSNGSRRRTSSSEKSKSRSKSREADRCRKLKDVRQHKVLSEHHFGLQAVKKRSIDFYCESEDSEPITHTNAPPTKATAPVNIPTTPAIVTNFDTTTSSTAAPTTVSTTSSSTAPESTTTSVSITTTSSLTRPTSTASVNPPETTTLGTPEPTTMTTFSTTAATSITTTSVQQTTIAASCLQPRSQCIPGQTACCPVGPWPGACNSGTCAGQDATAACNVDTDCWSNHCLGGSCDTGPTGTFCDPVNGVPLFDCSSGNCIAGQPGSSIPGQCA